VALAVGVAANAACGVEVAANAETPITIVAVIVASEVARRVTSGRCEVAGLRVTRDR